MTHPLLRLARDRALVPLATRLAGARATRALLQEPPATLLAIGRE